MHALKKKTSALTRSSVMCEMMVDTFQVSAVSRGSSRLVIENCPGFPPSQYNSYLSSCEVKTYWKIESVTARTIQHYSKGKIH